MSRNLSLTNCYFCAGDVIHDEAPRLITQDDAGAYFSEYTGMSVANAHCQDCEAKYLAWVRGCPSWNYGHLAYSNYPATSGHIDLSFRSTFNDEPGETDMPVYRIVSCRVDKNGILSLTPGTQQPSSVLR